MLEFNKIYHRISSKTGNIKPPYLQEIDILYWILYIYTFKYFKKYFTYMYILHTYSYSYIVNIHGIYSETCRSSINIHGYIWCTYILTSYPTRHSIMRPLIYISIDIYSVLSFVTIQLYSWIWSIERVRRHVPVCLCHALGFVQQSLPSILIL